MADQSVENTIHKDKRRWWVALLMLFPTGAGYIYVGRPWRFVAYSAFILLVVLAQYSMTQGIINYPAIFPVFMAPVLVVLAAFAIDIIMISAKQTSHKLRWPQRRKWYMASLVLWAAIALMPGIMSA